MVEGLGLRKRFHGGLGNDNGSINGGKVAYFTVGGKRGRVVVSRKLFAVVLRAAWRDMLQFVIKAIIRQPLSS